MDAAADIGRAETQRLVGAKRTQDLIFGAIGVLVLFVVMGLLLTLVADLLMFERAFPRSLMFSMLALKRHFERATALTPDSRSVRAAREIALLELDLRAADSANVIRSGLHQFLDDFQVRLGRIDEALMEDIFRALPEEATAGASA